MIVPTIGRHRMTTQGKHSCRQVPLVGRDHAAFTGGDDFISEERETPQSAKSTSLDVVSRGAARLRDVFHDQGVGYRLCHAVTIGRISVKMDSYNSPGAWADAAMNTFRREIPILNRYIRKNRRGATC